jgi:hypothetical protein
MNFEDLMMKPGSLGSLERVIPYVDMSSEHFTSRASIELRRQNTVQDKSRDYGDESDKT